MHDPVQRVFGRLLGHRRLAEGHHLELAVEYFRVKAHRISAVAVEGQIGNGLWHGRFLAVLRQIRYFGVYSDWTNGGGAIRLARRKILCIAGSTTTVVRRIKS